MPLLFRGSLPRCLTVSVAALLGFGAASGAQAPATAPAVAQLKRLTLEELLNVHITSVSRRGERFSEAASAVTVFTSEAIRRHGATTLADTLRLPAGLHVAQQNSQSWAIGVRGFNLLSSNKLLVLLDGRSLYTPLNSGVFWDVQDTMLEDIERLEIIRGPGATLWGANAVNGVISIRTQPAHSTLGTLVTFGAGNEEKFYGAVRHGFRVTEGVNARVYVKGSAHDGLVRLNGDDAGDDWKRWQSGFRLDHDREGQPTRFTIQGDLYRGRQSLLDRREIDVTGGNLLGRWTHSLTPDHSVEFQTYYDRVERLVPGRFGEKRHTFDVDGQVNMTKGRHQLVAGLNARLSSDDTREDGTVRFEPESRRMRLISGFVQDEIGFFEERLGLTFGAKFEHNSSTGFEYQPSVRAAWKHGNKSTVWAAISRAVRTPTRFDDDIRVFLAPTDTTAFIRGDPAFQSEELFAFELGYRLHPRSAWAIDISLFANRYDDLRTIEPQSSGLPLVLENRLNARTSGGEISFLAELSRNWRMRACYAYLDKSLSHDPGSLDVFRGTTEGNDPRHLATLTSRVDFAQHWEFDTTIRYVDALPSPAIPAYTAVDLRLGWRPTSQLEIAIVGQNLFDPSHREFGDIGASHEVQRSVHGKITWRF